MIHWNIKEETEVVLQITECSSGEWIFSVWKKEVRSRTRHRFGGFRICSILNAKLSNWDFIWQTTFEKQGGMPRKPRLRSQLLVIVVDSLIQSGYLSFYCKKSIRRSVRQKIVLIENTPSLPWLLKPLKL